jgi:thiol-disulfide isomerase/thioredoxin
MKKLFTILTICWSLSSFAQLADGSVAPDFTVTDINGNSHRLYDYLNNGYTVIIDISATWCPPCWSYHNQHILENVWASHGPSGELGVNANTTNDVIVLFFEGDPSTTLDQLNGIGTGTLGDWTEGVSYPIIDDATISSLYQIGYIPTIYTICSDKTVSESGQLSVVSHYNFAQECPEEEELVSINENKNTLFNVYPNPASSVINIKFDSQFEKENATISISNLLGKEVIALNNIISNNTSIDVSSLKNGIYFVNTNLKGSITTEKIVILK